MEYSTDEELMERFAYNGDRRSMGMLVRRYAPTATGAAFRLLRSGDEAQDAVQDAFVNIIRARSDYRPHSPFGPWFYRILRNVCLDMLRKRKSYDNALVRLAGEKVPEEDPPAENRRSPFLELVGRLPEKDRRVLMLRVIDGLQLTEIAELCGCTEEAAKKRAQRGLKRLKSLVEHDQTAVDQASVPALMSIPG